MYDKHVTFLGYAPEKLFPTRLDEMKEDKIRKTLFQTITELYGKGYRTFVSDLSAGFGLMAADTVIIFRKTIFSLLFSVGIDSSNAFIVANSI